MVYLGRLNAIKRVFISENGDRKVRVKKGDLKTKAVVRMKEGRNHKPRTTGGF